MPLQTFDEKADFDAWIKPKIMEIADGFKKKSIKKNERVKNYIFFVCISTQQNFPEIEQLPPSPQARLPVHERS